MVDAHADPRTEDTLAYELVRTPAGGSGEVVGRATFIQGSVRVDAPEAIRVAVEELLDRAFVDRVQADERPRGYRRTGSGAVEMLIPGMAEHFIARMRGLWLSYPDGAVVTAAPATGASLPAVIAPTSADLGPPVTDPALRRATLTAADEHLDKRPLVIVHPPDTGLRPGSEVRDPSRTDCGWLV